MPDETVEEYQRVKSDQAYDGNSERPAQVDKEQDMDAKILDTISNRKPLLKYENSMRVENMAGFYFSRRVELKDIVQDENQTKSKTVKFQEDKDQDDQNDEDEDDAEAEDESSQMTDDRVVETAAKRPETPPQKDSAPLEPLPQINDEMAEEIELSGQDRARLQANKEAARVARKVQRDLGHKVVSKQMEIANVIKDIKTDTIFD